MHKYVYHYDLSNGVAIGPITLTAWKPKHVSQLRLKWFDEQWNSWHTLVDKCLDVETEIQHVLNVNMKDCVKYSKLPVEAEEQQEAERSLQTTAQADENACAG